MHIKNLRQWLPLKPPTPSNDDLNFDIDEPDIETTHIKGLEKDHVADLVRSIKDQALEHGLEPQSSSYYEFCFLRARKTGSYDVALRVAGDASVVFPSDSIWIERQAYINMQMGRNDAALAILSDQRDRLTELADGIFVLSRTRLKAKRALTRVDRCIDDLIQRDADKIPAANGNDPYNNHLYTGTW